MKFDTISILSRLRIQSEQDVQRMAAERRRAQAMEFKHAEPPALSGGQQEAGGGEAAVAPEPFVREDEKSAATNRVPAVPARNSSSATGSDLTARKVRVAAGLLIDAEGRLLIADRSQAGAMQEFWEFPGGQACRW